MSAEGDTVIVGLGKTGLSCARFLAQRGVAFTVTDTRAEPPGLAQLRQELPDAPVQAGGFDAMTFYRAKRLIVSPGVPLREAVIAAAINRGVTVEGDIELFAQTARAPVLAVTGSNGKSTVTTLVGDMLRDAGHQVSVGGNLGTPALELLDKPEPDYYVLELSSFQLETTHSLNAAAAVVLNISPDHLDRYLDIEEYAVAKSRIFQGAGVMVLNADDPRVQAMARKGRSMLSFTLREPADGQFGIRERQGRAWLARGDALMMAVSELRIKGMHNAANALAALALGEAIGLPLESMLTTLRRFPGLPHRTQWVAEHGGVSWYNDSKGTNIGATIAALEGMPGKVVLIAGGLGKGADFSLLRPATEAKARAVVLIGRDAPRIAKALEGATRVVLAGNMAEAVLRAAELALAGDTVLLSPACASFDMFSGYEERGQVFMAEVQKVVA